MKTQAGLPYLLGRVAARTGAGLWRNRGGLLLALVVLAGLGAYMTITWTGALSAGPVAIEAGAGDCADTAMAAIADKSSAATQRAYECMDRSFQQKVTQAEFTRQLSAQSLPAVAKLARIGDYRTASGGTMVYYAVDGGGQSVGYIVYLSQSGRVLRIE